MGERKWGFDGEERDFLEVVTARNSKRKQGKVELFVCFSRWEVVRGLRSGLLSRLLLTRFQPFSKPETGSSGEGDWRRRERGKRGKDERENGEQNMKWKREGTKVVQNRGLGS